MLLRRNRATLTEERKQHRPQYMILCV